MQIRPIQLAYLAMAAVLLVGCQTQRSYTHRDVQPLYDNTGQASSLTLSTSAVRTANPLHQHAEPWYIDRNDYGPFVTAGHLSLRYEQSVTYTRDQQYTFNGRVYDRYDETTYRRTYSGSIR